MKNIFPIIILLSGIVSMSSSCNNKIKSEDKPTEITKKIEDEIQMDKPEMTPHSMEADCHGVRKTIRTVTDKEGVIMLIGSNITISIPPGTKRYEVCDVDVPKEFKKEGLKVRFSGEILEIFHNERLMGTPTRLTKIDIIKN